MVETILNGSKTPVCKILKRQDQERFLAVNTWASFVPDPGMAERTEAERGGDSKKRSWGFGLEGKRENGARGQWMGSQRCKKPDVG